MSPALLLLGEGGEVRQAGGLGEGGEGGGSEEKVRGAKVEGKSAGETKVRDQWHGR